MSGFRPSSSQGGHDNTVPPFTPTTDASYDYDPSRPSTSAGGQQQWTYDPESRPTTSRAGRSRGQGAQYTGGEDYIDEEEEWEESEDEDVFTYLPPNTSQQQQLQQLQNAHAQAQRQQQMQQRQRQPRVVDSAPFAYLPPTADTSAPPSAAFTSSTPYTPTSPITPTSAVPLQALNSYYGQQPMVTTRSVVSSPPDTTSTAPPFAYDPPAAGQSYTESYRMTPLSTSGDGAPPASMASSQPISIGSREVHVSLPNNGGSTNPGSVKSGDGTGVGAASSTIATSHAQKPSLGEEEMGLRYRRDSKRTKGSSSADSVDIRNGAESLKTDVSLSNVPYTPSLPSTPGGHMHRPHGYLDEEEEDSPYPEVRASVSNTDDPDMPALTFRSWLLGLLFCIIGAGLNLFFNFRYPAPYLSPLILLLIAYPFGRLLAYMLPITSWTVPAGIPLIGGSEFSFNPGPFNVKEHVLIYIMANVSVNPAYGMNVIVVAQQYYNYEFTNSFQYLIILGTQLTGFALAGMCRRFLVWPGSLIWPANLVTCTLLNTLHAEADEDEGSGMSRYRFFVIATTTAFVWWLFPGFIFQALSLFTFVCWIRPNNVVLNQLFGYSTGLGMSFLTFDWNQISYIASPLMVPWWAQVHIFAGFVIFYWILCPAMYYTNTWSSAHLPISGNNPYDKFAKPYDVQRVLNKDMSLNITAYYEYSPLYLPATYVITYLLAFMLATAVLVHTALYHGRTLFAGVKRLNTEDDDIHAKLMRNYPEVPNWWYMTIFVVFFGFAIAAVEVGKTGTPIWALLLALLIPIIYIIPSSYIFAMTGQPVGVNLQAEIIPGVLLAGKPLANMIFKCYSIQTMQSALGFTQDLKLGHYMKVPPRATFAAQVVATLVASFVQVGVKQWMFANIHDLCQDGNADHLSCPNNQVFFAASAVWGLIGPTRQFGKGAAYHPELYMLLVGALLPVPFWLWQRRHPKSFLKYVNIPVLLNGPTYIPPATGINFSSWFLTGVIFQYVIRTRNFRWWSKFNYILSASLDSGTIISVVVVFLCLQYPKNGNIHLKWWGNTVFIDTADVKGVPYLATGPDGF